MENNRGSTVPLYKAGLKTAISCVHTTAAFQTAVMDASVARNADMATTVVCGEGKLIPHGIGKRGVTAGSMYCTQRGLAQRKRHAACLKTGV